MSNFFLCDIIFIKIENIFKDFNFSNSIIARSANLKKKCKITVCDLGSVSRKRKPRLDCLTIAAQLGMSCFIWSHLLVEITRPRSEIVQWCFSTISYVHNQTPDCYFVKFQQLSLRKVTFAHSCFMLLCIFHLRRWKKKPPQRNKTFNFFTGNWCQIICITKPLWILNNSWSISYNHLNSCVITMKYQKEQKKKNVSSMLVHVVHHIWTLFFTFPNSV